MKKPRYLLHAEAVHRTEQIEAQLQASGLSPKKRRSLMGQWRYWQNKRSRLS